MPPRDALVFFLGGHDLEMVTIRELLLRHVPPERVHDRRLRWGAAASAYAAEVRAALAAGHTPVLVELQPDLPEAELERCILVDHHGDLAGRDRPTSLEQLYELLGRPEPWSDSFRLVAANDRGYIEEMVRQGATAEQMRAVRAADRRAQGITDEEERQGRAAAARAHLLAGGELTLVECPHDRTAAVTDALDDRLGGPGFKNLLLRTPGHTHFFGRGDWVRALHGRFGGWYGGALPERGFWGCDRELERDELSAVLGVKR